MLLQPNKKLLDSIGWNNESHYHWTEFAVKGFKKPSLEFGCHSSYIWGYMEMLKTFYNINWGIIFTDYFIRRYHFDLLSDGLANCREHGCFENNSPSFYHGVFFAPLGICSGFKDSGGYYKRPEIKEIFETKNLEALKKIQKRISFGTINIFELSDLIEVDTDNETLYCTQKIMPIHIQERIKREWGKIDSSINT